MVIASQMRAGAVYRRTSDPGRFWYTKPKAGAARRLVQRLRPRAARLSTCDREALRAAQAELAGDGVLAVRHLRGVDPLTGDRYELEDYVLLPPNYRLREVKKKPGYEER
jgi:hypothetical protein